MPILNVPLAERSYPIHIGRNLLPDAGKYLKEVLTHNKVFIITDETVAGLHLNALEISLSQNGFQYHTIIVPAGENTKRFAILEYVLNQVLAKKPERNTTLIALGGGVIGDLTGFAASILLRGVNFVQIPTTLLAQVDSSVGGKTGINTPYGKNLVGTFYQPKLVLADMALLNTLPDREFKAGYAEIVKYGLINNPGFFAWLEAHEDEIRRRDIAILEEAVLVSCKSKADIVAKDEREGGVRALLNLGHTFGHALEAEMGYSGALLHGEAVAIGMVMAFEFSARAGFCSPDDVKRVIKHLKAVGLPVSMHDVNDYWNRAALIGHMYQDKKVHDGKLVFILAKGIGQAFIKKDVNEEDIIL